MKRLFLALALAIIFCPFIIPSHAEENKVEIKDGAVYFPETYFQRVPLSRLILKFPQDCPQDLLSVKGKIFKGTMTRPALRGIIYTSVTYVIPLGYNSDTKEMSIYILQERGYVKGYETKSVQGTLRGKFDPENVWVLRWVLRPGTDIMTSDYRLSFLKNGNLRIDKSDRYSGDLSPVANLPEETQEK